MSPTARFPSKTSTSTSTNRSANRSSTNTSLASASERGTTTVPSRRERTVNVDSAATPSSRNRAIDLYRAFAMCAVALGHWLAADVRINEKGNLAGGNALDRLGSLHILTWVFQVMPLFFCIGGFSNAASLDGHWRGGGTSPDWVRARLRRLVAPASWLAGIWLAIVVLSQVFGFAEGTVLDAAGVAAIPLWFLANYVADTALAPITLRLFRSHRKPFLGVLAATFLVCESTRFFGIHYLLQLNIVVGWLLFQVIGFAWRDGLLPEPRKLVRIGFAALGTAGLLVAVGPWPLALVSVPGARFANTWPPSLVLIAYGIGSCSLFIAAAPRVSRFLTSHTKAWRVVVVANSMTMTSYLWHFTALAVAAGVCFPLHLLPTAPVGSGEWWLAKIPLMGVALVVLSLVIALLAGKERAGLLAAKVIDGRSASHAAAASIVMAGGFEVWTSAGGDLVRMLIGMVAVVTARVLVRTMP